MVKYEWDESNGVSVPTNKLMVIDADEYYVGMPLKKVDAETVAPTDGDPEYICLAQRNAGDEIRPLQIPVQEVFPDAVYTKILEDGTEEKVKFGGGGGGASSWNDLADKPIMIIDLTYLEGGDDATGEYPVALSKSFDEIQAAYENGVALFVRDGILFQVTGLDNVFLTCAGLWISPTATQSRVVGMDLMYKHDTGWIMIGGGSPLLYDIAIEGLILHSRSGRWSIEVDDDGRVFATAYGDK